MVETLNANVPLEKTRIISILKQRGPSVANAIAKALNMPNILTSAILSEMTADKTILSTHLKVGGSPLYYLQGQEAALSDFTKYLESKEREAFSKLKEFGILIDSELEPAIRIALRNIRDFAIPLKINIGEGKIVWKYYLLKNEDAEKKIKELFSETDKEKEITETERKEVKKEEPKEELKSEKSEKKTRRKTKVDLKSIVERWLERNKAELKSEIQTKNKEQSFIVSIPSEVGKLDFLLIAKNKKLSNADLAMAYQEGLDKKMPVIILTKKKVSKELEEYANSFGNYLLIRTSE